MSKLRWSDLVGLICALLALILVWQIDKNRSEKMARIELEKAHDISVLDSLNDAESGYVLASYYGLEYHGRMAANGHPFNMNVLCAAHQRLPMGTVIRVTREMPAKKSIEKKHRYLMVKKSVDVVIVDRGPYSGSRELDLSRAAAIQLGMMNAGVCMVYIEIIRPPRIKIK